jgi:hypothetical protein
MSWVTEHSESERLAAEAQVAARADQCELAEELYARAAKAEVRALSELDPSKQRTRGVTAVSAVALWYKAKQDATAEHLAHDLLIAGNLPEFAVEQLQTLLQSIWTERARERAGVRFTRGQVLVAVRGGQVVAGGAPLDLVVTKVEGVQALFYRATEFLQHLPLRKRGPASVEIQKMCRPWLFQTAPGSYQFAIAIEDPAQRSLFGPNVPSTREIADTVLQILRAAAEDPGAQMINAVPDPEYRGTFMKLVRSLAPSGKVFSELEVRSVGDPEPIRLQQESREEIGKALQRQFPKSLAAGDVEETLRGVLRAVHLDKDWLELVIGPQHVTVHEVSEAVDDLIGSLLNKSVIVETLKQPSGRYKFREIMAAE